MGKRKKKINTERKKKKDKFIHVWSRAREGEEGCILDSTGTRVGFSQLCGNENATKAALGLWKGKVPGGQVCTITMGLVVSRADLQMDPPRSH